MELIKQRLRAGILQDAPEGGKEPGILTADDAKIINALPNPPPVPLKEGDAYVRRCRLFGAVVNTTYGCPREEDLERWLELTQGAPAMVGHIKSDEPIGRWFGGALVEFNGVKYIEPKLYWLRSLSYAEDLRAKIDGGIISEASLGFAFESPVCSICGNDIRDGQNCPHFPGKEYDGQLCFYWYDTPISVYEGSLVYRGANPGTGFGMPEALTAALDVKQKQLSINKKGDPDMDFKEICQKLGLPGDTTEDKLKTMLADGRQAITDLTTAKEQINELTVFKTGAEPVLKLRNEEAVRLMNLVHDGKPDELMKATLENASPEQVEKFITDLTAQAEVKFPLTCQDCGSVNIKGRSSTDETNGNSPQPKPDTNQFRFSSGKK